MRTILLFFFCSVQLAFAAPRTTGNEPDSVYLFSYATAKNNHHNGLHFAWSIDKQQWHTIGNEYGFVKSDYGAWGSEKRMINPYLLHAPDGSWQCVWSLNEREPIFAQVSSPDLVYWGRQSYPAMTAGAQCLQPVIQYDASTASYTILYTTAAKQYFSTTTREGKKFNPAREITAAVYSNASITVALPAGTATGQLHRVAWAVVEKLIRTYEHKQYQHSLNSEVTAQDVQRFAGLKPVTATITLQPQQAKPVSDLLMGVFFEDINYAADGGLYAELVQNRDFEYKLTDKDNRDKNWNSTHSWTIKGNDASFAIDSAQPLHPNNPHYAVLQTTAPGASLVNMGYDGIAIQAGASYHCSFFSRQPKAGKLMVRLVNKQGTILATNTVKLVAGNTWKKTSILLQANATAADAQLEIQPLDAGSIAFDLISLFPQQTFKNRKNGLRADLAQSIADLHPRFVRFPGGCVAHGDGLGNIYRWKNTIGPLEARVPQRNLWSYHQTAGLGYFEYFQFCEDIGAVPVPVLAAGVPCQNSATGGGGQQGGIPMQEMDAYIQEVLDLVEYANGDVKTKWGKKRAEAGHPKPFHLKYIGIGNEDLISDVFEERFTMIFKAIQEKHPEITVIGTVGPFNEGTDYEEGWGIATKLRVPMVDEHYYQTPGWFINNQHFYDRYDRTKSKVYLGEYAAHLPGRPNNLETALAEALYLTALERNGDVVSMASYAPLLAKEGHTQWNPNLIYFNNTTVKPTVGYEVQKLFGLNAGNEYLPVQMNLSNTQDAVTKRVAVSVTRDTNTNDLILKLVNLLPVEVTPGINWNHLASSENQVTKIVLQGNPADKNSRPVTSVSSLSQAVNTLPPYSFTVIRIKRPM